jgi:hypothetical protein
MLKRKGKGGRVKGDTKDFDFIGGQKNLIRGDKPSR